MTLLLASVILAPNAPKIGSYTYLSDSSKPQYVVFEGNRWRTATFAEKRQIQLAGANKDSVPPSDPRGRYRLESSVYKSTYDVQGYNVVDKSRRVIARVEDMLASPGREGETHWLDVLGWGSPDDLVINRTNGSGSVGTYGSFISFNVRTHRLNPQVILACGKGLAVRIGERKKVEWGDPGKQGDWPLLYRLAIGKKPTQLRFEGQPVRSKFLQVSPVGRWIIAYAQKDYNYLLIDLSVGQVRKLPGNNSFFFLH